MTEQPRLRALLVATDAADLARVSGRLVAAEDVGAIHLAHGVAEALAVLADTPVDVVLTAAHLADGTGTDLARAIVPPGPAVVVVATGPELAVEAFEVGVVDYLVLPVTDARLDTTLRRVAALRATAPAAPPSDEDETVAVERGGTHTFVRRSQVTHATAHGDYVRLHTPAGTHLVRMSLAELERRWAPAGFARVHRSALVALGHVTAVRADAGRLALEVGGERVLVSRRHAPAVRALVARPGEPWLLHPAVRG